MISEIEEDSEKRSDILEHYASNFVEVANTFIPVIDKLEENDR